MFVLLFYTPRFSEISSQLRKLSGNENYDIIITISYQLFVLSEKRL